MAKSGKFEGFLSIYSKVIWALVGTVLLLGLLCASAHMHCGKGVCWHKNCPMVQKK